MNWHEHARLLAAQVTHPAAYVDDDTNLGLLAGTTLLHTDFTHSMCS